MAIFGPVDLGSMFKGVLEYIEHRSGQSDDASLAARQAVTLTRNYVGSIARGDPHNRDRQEAVAMAWTEAGSKVRRISEPLSEKFYKFAEFWSSFDEASFSMRLIEEYVAALVIDIADKRLEFRNPRDGGKFSV